jgi:hypothetical protein
MDKKKMYNTNKKGQVQYFLENAFRIGFLMIALLVFFLLINFYVVNRTDTNRLQSEVTADRIMYSSAIMYEENSRTYMGIVDITKFNDITLMDKINYTTKRHAAAKLDLVNNDDGQIQHTAYLNKAQYENLYILAKSGGKGKGGATIYNKYYPVTYIDGGKYFYGTIKMSIIIPNS